LKLVVAWAGFFALMMADSAGGSSGRGRFFFVSMSASCCFEITGLFDGVSDCHKLLYAPLAESWTYRESQVYQLEYEGDESAMRAFVERVLLDPISQKMQVGEGFAIQGAAFVLEYGMKGGALDLEKETIMNYFRGLQDPGFQLAKLTLRRRVYVFGSGARSEPFVRDVCNPAIHTWKVLEVAA
jgi:hypothetical protein